MFTPQITANNVFLLPSPASSAAATRQKFVATADKRCRALIKLPGAHDHQGPQCSRRKVTNTAKAQSEKSHREIVADELCSQHTLMLDRFIDMITKQLREERMVKLESARGSPNVANGLAFNDGMASTSGPTNRGADAVNTAAPMHSSTTGNIALTSSFVGARTSSSQSNRNRNLDANSTRPSIFSSRHSTTAPFHPSITSDFARIRPFVAARTPSSQSNRNLNTNSTRTSISSNRHSSRLSTGFHAAPSFTTSQRLTSSSNAQKEQNLLVKSTLTLIYSHKPRQHHLNTEVAEAQKASAVVNLGFQLDNLLTLHDSISGFLIQDCQVLIANHTFLEEQNFLSTNKHSVGKLRKLKQLIEQANVLRRYIDETAQRERVDVGGKEQDVGDTEEKEQDENETWF